MKKKLIVILIILVIMFIFTNYKANTYGGATEYLINELDNRILTLMYDYNIPGVNIALIESGEIKWAKSFGYSRVEDNVKMKITTICRTQSISKSVTAWGIMKLVEENKIDLDDPIDKYLGDFKEKYPEVNLNKITIKNLLSNNSGLSLGTVGIHYKPDEALPSIEENLSKEIKYIQEPGSEFNYSNTGFNLLELIIENVTGKKFSLYMEEEILKPLDMNNSNFTMNKKIQKQLPYGYDLNGEHVLPYVYPEKASGGLLSSLEDIASFIKFEMIEYNQTNILEDDLIEKMHTKSVETSGIYSLISDSYGFGHFIEYFDNKKAIFHGGQGHGWMSHYHFIPEDGNGIVIFTNSQRSWPLISYILKDWGKYYGYNLKMTKIIYGVRLMGLFIIAIITYFFYNVFKLFRNKFYNKQVEHFEFLDIFQVISALIILFLLYLTTKADYIFLASVFPNKYNWLRVSILGLSISIILKIFYKYDRRIKNALFN